MKIRIKKGGALWIERAGVLKPSKCPHELNGCHYDCGDWCALFKEPVTDDYGDYKLVEIELCEVSLFVKPEDFEDMR